MHVHTSALQAVLVFLMVIALGIVWRTASAYLADSPAGRAMAYAY